MAEQRRRRRHLPPLFSRHGLRHSRLVGRRLVGGRRGTGAAEDDGLAVGDHLAEGAEGGAVFVFDAFTAWTITEGMRDFDESWPSGIEPRDCASSPCCPRASCSRHLPKRPPFAAHRRARRLVDRHDGVEVARVVVRIVVVVGVVDREAAVRRGDPHLDRERRTGAARGWPARDVNPRLEHMWESGLEPEPEPLESSTDPESTDPESTDPSQHRYA